MDQLREFRAEVPELAEGALTGAERAFVTTLRGERPGRARLGSHRPLVLAAGLATAAAGVAVAVVLASNPAPPPAVAGGSATPPAAGSSGSSGSAGSAAAAAPAITPVSVAEVLDLAAAARGGIAPAPGQFVVIESLVSDEAQLGDVGRFLYQVKITTWTASDNSKPGVARTEQLEPLPYPGEPVPAGVPAAGAVDLHTVCPVKGGAARQDYAFYGTLPADAKGMLDYFRRFPGGGADKDQYLWKAGAELAAAPMPAAQHAAVFQALKLVPGAKLVGDVRDAAGRKGTAIGRTGLDGRRRDLIFDPVTFAFLGSRTFNAGGVQVGSAAQLSVTVADEAPPAPLGPKQGPCA